MILHLDGKRVILQCSAREMTEDSIVTCPVCGSEDIWLEQTVDGLDSYRLMYVLGCAEKDCEREIILIHEKFVAEIKR